MGGILTGIKAAVVAGAKGYSASKAATAKAAAEALRKKGEMEAAAKSAAKAAKVAKELAAAKKGAAAYKNVKVAAGSSVAGAAGGAYAMNKYNKSSAEEAKLLASRKAAAAKQIKKDLPTWMVKSLDKKKKGGATDSKWIQKAVNPKHKGYCTPMSKPTCTPKRAALARTFKAMAKNK
jgi:hypothetical protein